MHKMLTLMEQSLLGDHVHMPLQCRCPETEGMSVRMPIISRKLAFTFLPIAMLIVTANINACAQYSYHSNYEHPYTIKSAVCCIGNVRVFNETGDPISYIEWSYQELKQGMANRTVSITGFSGRPFYVCLEYMDGGSPVEPVPPFQFCLTFAEPAPDNPNFDSEETRQAALVVKVLGPPYYGLYHFEIDFEERMRGDIQPFDMVGDDIIDMRDIGYTAHRLGKTQQDPDWNLPDFVADLNRDGTINMIEIEYLAKHFGQQKTW